MPERPPDDALPDLVARMATGDQAAADELYRATVSRVVAFTRRILRDRADAEDAALDTYVQAWRSAAAFELERGSVMAWLLCMARTRALDRLRQRDVARPAVHSAGDDLVDQRPIDPVQKIAQSERDDRLRAAVGRLSPAQRRVIEACFFDGHSHSEAAALLSEPLGTVKTRVRAGLQALRRLAGSEAEP